MNRKEINRIRHHLAEAKKGLHSLKREPLHESIVLTIAGLAGVVLILKFVDDFVFGNDEKKFYRKGLKAGFTDTEAREFASIWVDVFNRQSLLQNWIPMMSRRYGQDDVVAKLRAMGIKVLVQG